MQPSDKSALVVGRAARAAMPVPDAPAVTAAAVEPLRAIDAVDESGALRALQLPMERPLTVVLDGRELVTLMTLGAAPEWLVLGYLRNQRLIDRAGAVHSLAVDWSRCRAEVILRQCPPAAKRDDRPGSGAPATGCALGTEFAEAMRRCALPGEPRVPAAGLPAGAEADAVKRMGRGEILSILETMRGHDAIHRAAGSVHSCALFRKDELWVAVEDVSRHNGIDTITGFMSLHGIEGADKILFSTGRLTAEMVMKAAHNGIPVMISRNGTTAMGYELAAAFGMTLIGRAANRRYLCYLGAGRIDSGA